MNTLDKKISLNTKDDLSIPLTRSLTSYNMNNDTTIPLADPLSPNKESCPEKLTTTQTLALDMISKLESGKKFEECFDYNLVNNKAYDEILMSLLIESINSLKKENNELTLELKNNNEDLIKIITQNKKLKIEINDLNSLLTEEIHKSTKLEIENIKYRVQIESTK